MTTFFLDEPPAEYGTTFRLAREKKTTGTINHANSKVKGLLFRFRQCVSVSVCDLGEVTGEL